MSAAYFSNARHAAYARAGQHTEPECSLHSLAHAVILPRRPCSAAMFDFSALSCNNGHLMYKELRTQSLLLI